MLTLPPFLFLAILILSYALYAPGLAGPFLLDDYANLDVLERFQGVDSLNKLLQFLTAIPAGPLGRPISLLSFLIDDNAWPSDPQNYKHTNLCFHLLNGALITWLSLKLARILGAKQLRAEYIAVIAAALWLLHPLNVSTVLYVVQRMTILSALFTVLGLLIYVQGREILASKPVAGYILMTAGIVGGTLLATLSKENGALLPLYALIIERCILRSNLARDRYWDYFEKIVLWGPVFLMALHFASGFRGTIDAYASRAFSLKERLYTEARILVEYLMQIMAPNLSGSGLFHDDYQLSISLLEPPQTLAAILFWVVIFVAAMVLRWKLPLYAFAVFWFLGGHVLESTFIPLELYFEHRNYLPMLGLIFAAVYGMAVYPWRRRMQVVTTVSAIAGIALIAWITASQAKLWGNSLQLAAVWAYEHPTSVRAQQAAANLWLALGDYQRAKDALKLAKRYNADAPELDVQILQVGCIDNSLTTTEVEQAMASLKSPRSIEASVNRPLIMTMPKLYQMASSCNHLDNAMLDSIVDDMIANTRFGAEIKASLYALKGQRYANNGDLNSAMEMLDSAFVLKADINIALLQSTWLLSAGLYDDAAIYLEKARLIDAAGKWPYQNLRHADIQGIHDSIVAKKAQ